MAEKDPLQLLQALLQSDDVETLNTSMRLPASLQQAARLAVEEWHEATSTTALMAEALRRHLTTLLMRHALDEHYAEYPLARPSLAEVALALAVQDGSPVADRTDLVELAAEHVTRRRPDADAENVVLFAEGLLEASTAEAA